MKFKAGMLGVCAVVLALLGTIVLGTLTSIEETSSTRTGYRTVADVTGLVDTDRDPYFTDYNPSKNWTGYYISGTDSTYISGVDFTTTTQANNYPLYENNPVTTTGSINLDGLGDEALVSSGYDGLRIYRSSSNYTPGTIYTENPKIVTLATVVNSIKTRTTTSITIDGAEFDSSYFNPLRAYIVDQGNGQASPFFPSYNSKSITAGIMNWGVGGANMDTSGTRRALYNSWTVDVSSMTATSGGVTYDANIVLVVWGGTPVQNGSSITPQAIPSTLAYSKTDSNIQYMDVSKGVSLNTYGGEDSVIWENGYYNGSMDMILKGSAGKSISMSIDVASWDGSAWSGAATNTIRIDWVNDSGTYKTKFTVNGVSPVSIGGWNNVKVHIDAEAGEVIAEPITYFGNYTTFTTSAPIKVGDFSVGAFNQITFNPLSGVNAPEMEVIGTRVYMNTYGAVFRDASLDVRTYFPDYPRYAVSFGNYALTGTSLQVNGINLPVEDKSFTYDGKTYSLQGVSIVYYDNVVIEGDGFSLDLGTLATTSLYFGGVWYMPIFFKEAYTYEESAYEWIPYGFGLDFNASVLAFIGISLGILLLASTFKVKPKAMDWVVIVFAGFIAAGLLVV